MKKPLKGVQAMLQHVEKPVVASYDKLDLIELVLVDMIEEAHGENLICFPFRYKSPFKPTFPEAFAS